MVSRNFFQRDVSLGEERSGNPGLEFRSELRMIQYKPLEFFQNRRGHLSGMGPRVVVELAHAA